MDGALLVKSTATRETLHSEYTPAGHVRMYPDESQSKSSPGVTDENRAIKSIPTALNSMLKKTTETGDIGQFAIRPSQLPPSRKIAGTGKGHILRTQQYSFQSSNGPKPVDDRRRLPSYARDATSEIVSLYETASQKAPNSPRIFEVPDHRSYSMTQTPYLSNVLLNHRSYTSLRSQPEPGSMPRPRSPFLYPARLRRLGFQPSSPTLTEGETVKRGKYVEQEQILYAAITNARSAPSLSTNFKRHISPSTLPLNSSRAFPSQVGHFQSGSRHFPLSVSPVPGSTRDSNFHPEPTLFKASQAFDNSIYASTPVSYHRRSPNSFTSTSTSSKSHAPSPLYYDYTEDFNLEGAHEGEGTADDAASSLRFVIDQSIAELREVADDGLVEYNARPQNSSNNDDCHIPVKSFCRDNLELPDEEAVANSEYSQAERSTNITQDIIPLYLDRGPYESTLASSSHFIDPSKSATTAKFADKFLILEDNIGQTDDHMKPLHLREEIKSTSDENTSEKMSDSDRTSSLRLSTFLPIFPKPPDQTMCVVTKTGSQAQDQVLYSVPITDDSFQVVQQNAPQAEKKVLNYEQQVALNDHTEEVPRQLQLNLPSLALQCSSTTGDMGIRSSRYYSIDHGLSDLAQLISNFEFANGLLTPQKVRTEPAENDIRLSVLPLRNPIITGSPKHPSALLGETSSGSNTSLESCILPKTSRSHSDLKAPSSEPFVKGIFASGQDLVSSGDGGKDMRENSSVYDISAQQVSRTALSFSGPSLHTLQALSPTRLLRLKNSVPHLMKALPPVPQNPKSEFPFLQRLSHCEPTSISSPKDFERSNTSTEIEQIHDGGNFIQSLPSQQDLGDIPELEQIYQAPQKFTIKSNCFDAQRSRSPTNSRPWNLDENYPWHSQQSNIRLSPLRSILPGNQIGPKFKLRVTRASTSPSGTVRIHPEARSSFELRSPRDLFTSSSSLSGIFRQVGRRFSSKTSNTARETTLDAGAQATLRNNEICDNNPDLLGPPIAPMRAYPMSPTEVRSFFSEESSQIRAHHSLRKRISNLRARIPNPYSSRTAPQNNGNEGQKAHTVPYVVANEGSSANIDSEREDEYGMPVTVLQHKRLRSKISGWFRDAGMATRRRVKLRNKDEVCCIPYR